MKHFLRRHAPELLVLILSALVFRVAWVLHARGLPYDDAFITLTYARNIAAGHGFIFNGGQPWLGTTAPLLALLLAALARLAPDASAILPVLALWLGALLWAGATWLAFFIGRRLLDAWAGVAMAAMLATTGIFAYVIWSEYPLMIFLSLAALLLLLRQQQGWSGALFALAFLARGDAAILAAVAGLMLWGKERRFPWRLALGFILMLTPWIIYAFSVFGNPLPATLGIKRAHRLMGAWPHLAMGFYEMLRHSPAAFLFRFGATVALAGGGLWHFWRQRQAWPALFIMWAILYAVAYLLLDVPYYYWYFTPLAVALGLGAMLALFSWLQAAPRPRRASWLVWGMVAALALAGVLGQQHLAQRTAKPSAKIAAYVQAATWLRQQEPDSTVASIEVGTLGYVSQRQVLDLLGLVTPGAAPYLRQKDTASFFEDLAPDYYLRNRAFDSWGMNRQIHESAFFLQHYEPIETFPQAGKPPVIIYRRIDN